MAMLPSPCFLKTPAAPSMSLPIDIDTHDELRGTRKSPSPPTYEERMDNHLRRRRSFCPEPEDLECVEIPALEFYRAQKRIKTVDSKLEDMSIPNARSDELIETVQELLQGPTDLGSLNLSSGSSPSVTYGGFTAINEDWPSSRRTLSSAKENSIPGIQTGGSTASDQECQTPLWTTWSSAEQIPISIIQTGGFTAINRDWPSCKTPRSSSEKCISGPQVEGSPISNKEWQTPNNSSLWFSEGMSIALIQTDGTIETDGAGVATVVNTSLNVSNGPIDLTSPDDVNRSAVEDHFPTNDKSFESFFSDGDPSKSECSTYSYSDREPEHETNHFQGTTFHHPRLDALHFAFQEQNFQPRAASRYRLVLWADGSGEQTRAAEAVSWRDPEDPETWKIRGRCLPWMQDSLVTELCAIAHGFEVAVEQITSHQNRSQTHVRYDVLVFSDCLSAIQRVGENRGSHTLRLADVNPVNRIFMSSAQLRQLGARVELHWVPGHVGVLGNELSDLAARYAVKAEVIDVGLTMPWAITPDEAREELRLAIIQLRAKQASEPKMDE